MKDLNGYTPSDLIKIEDNIYEDPDGRRYKREDCSSEVCAQGCKDCNCEGTGYRFRKLQ